MRTDLNGIEMILKKIKTNKQKTRMQKYTDDIWDKKMI